MQNTIIRGLYSNKFSSGDAGWNEITDKITK